MHFAFWFFRSLFWFVKFLIHLSSSMNNLSIWIEMNTYQRCQKPNEIKVLWCWNSTLSKKLCYADELAMIVCLCEWVCVRFFRFFPIERTKNTQNLRTIRMVLDSEKRKKWFYVVVKSNEKKKLCWIMMAVVGLWCVFMDVCVCVAPFFFYSYEKMATICQTSEYVVCSYTYEFSFVCLL